MISLLFAGNAAAFDGLLIAALSISKHTKDPMRVFILTMDLSERNPDFVPLGERHREYLEKIYRRADPNSSVVLIDAGDRFRAELADSPNAVTGYTPYCFLRLFSDRIPEIPDKVLYLDTDIVAAGDIRPLFEKNIEGFELAAALDYYGRYFMGYHYFNSGVMLLNLPEIRRSGLFRRAVKLLNRRRLFLPDQTALNRLIKRKYILPGRYNEQKHFPDDTVIQHFTKTIIWTPYFHTRTIKPWQVDTVKSVLTDKYNDILDAYVDEKKKFEEETL